MISRLLWIDPKKCNGCRECETACALVKTGTKDPARSRIRVIDWNLKGFYLPVSCQHCETAPCLAVCPKEAIHRHPLDGRVMVDYDLCVSCRMCVAVCPFGAMGFDKQIRMVIKCDLCDGDPACVLCCEPGALIFANAGGMHERRTRAAALRLAVGLKGENTGTGPRDP